MSDTIRFILNGEAREVSNLSPQTTVLQYLRGPARLTGTKEGCAEGDCGACTVIVGDLKDGEVHYQSVNACILFLPVLDGRQIITVEHLKTMNGGNLNPVQEAMVSCHGSQCGFCTPGFVVSLSCLLHNNPNADDTAIQDSIAGNLCRCTGYRPILDAARLAKSVIANVATAPPVIARSASDEAIQKGGLLRSARNDGEGLKKLQRTKMFAYEHNAHKFFAPVTGDELSAVLAVHPDATLLAGGTDVGLWVTKHHRDLKTIVYTGNVRDLKNIEATKDGLKIGAAVSYTKAFESLAAYDESLEELLRRLGSVQIRNSGTIGGNIANGSPIGDGMPPLIALRAQIILRSSEGRRTVNLEDYFIAYGKQDRKQSEYLESIIVPRKPDNVIFKTYKISKRFDQDISAVCAAFALTIDGDKITDARIAFGGMAATPKRADKTEALLKGKPWTETTARTAKAELAKDYAPISDMRASADYRRSVAQNLLYRFWLETSGSKPEARVYGYAG